MITKNFLGPADLLKAHTFYIYELLKIIIVNEHKNHIFAAFQVMLPGFK